MKKSVLFISAMFVWMGVFLQTGLPQSAAPLEEFTATLYPVNMTDGTGYITSYLPTGPFQKKGPWMNVSMTVNDTLGRGYMKFDISSLPADAVITQATLNYYNFYREPTSYENSMIFPLAHDPVTTSGSALFYDCGDGVSLWEGQWGDEGTTDPTWINSMLNSNGIEYISDQLAAGWAGFGIVAGYNNFGRFSGYNDPVYRPWLEIGYYIPTTPLLSVLPVSGNFGRVNLGIQSLPQVFKIKNIGIGTVTVEELILHGDDASHFVLTDDAVYPKNLGAGESYTVSVAFKPASTGAKTAILRITENETINDFTLTGSAYLNGPLDLKATPVFGPYVDLSWAPPLPLAEIRYDDNFAMGYTYLQVSTTSDYYYTRITIPADGTLTNIGVYTNAISSPAAFESLSLCPDLDGFPDISSPIQTFPDVGVLSTGYAWILQPLAPLAVTAGQNYYIVTQCKDYTGGGLSIVISESSSSRCGYTRNGGLVWNSFPFSLFMRAYMTIAGDKSSNEPVVLTSGNEAEGMQNLPPINLAAGPKELLKLKSPGVMAPAIVAISGPNRSVSSYTVHRGTDWGSYNTTFTGISGTSYQDVTTDPTTEYYYMVSAEYPNGSANSNVWWVRTFETCPVPTALSATGITTSSASLGWTPNGTAAWELEWGLAGFEQGTGTMITTGVTNPYLLSDLTSATYYDFYVRSSCGDDSFSSWAGPFTFSTWCENTTVPYSENFDAYMEPSTGCVTVTNENIKQGTVWQTSTWSYQSEPNSIAISLGTERLMDDWFFTPGINLLAGTSYDVNFFYMNGDGGWSTHKLEVKWGTHPSRDGMTGDQIFNDANILNTNYVEGTGTFTVPADGVYYFGWHGYSDLVSNTMFVDDITIDVTPVCYKPKNVTVSDVSVTTATISWTASISAPGNGYEYEVRTSGAGGSGSTGLAVSGLTAAGVVTAGITGLTAFTTYHVYVRSDCGSDGYSVWSVPPAIFTTLCEATSVPYIENFDACVEPSTGCITVTNDNDDGDRYQWATTSSMFLSPFNSIRLRTYGDFTSDDWFFSAGLNLVAGTSYDVNFWYMGDGYSPEKLEVKWGAAPNAAGMTGGQIFSNEEILNDRYEEGTGTFTAPATGVYYVGWHGYSDAWMDFISVDDISIDVTPVCYKPRNVASSNVTTETATISWTASISSPGNGYEYEVRTSGAGGSGNTGLVVSGLTAAGVVTADVSGLESNTTYHVYVRSDCGSDGYSIWSAPACTFTTLCGSFPVPYAENFDAYEEPSTGCVSVIDGNGDNSQWATVGYYSFRSEPNSIMLWTYSDFPNDDWFFTPGLNLEAGRSYDVKFWYTGDGFSPEKLEVKWGTDPSADGMTGGQIFNNEEILNDSYTEGTGTFTAPETGVYYVGWHGYSDVYMDFISVDDISIEVVPLPVPLDLTVTGSVIGPEDNCYNATNFITVAGTDAFTVASGGSATFIAGVKINYLPGTTVESGGYMLGSISTGTYCEGAEMPLVAVVTGVEPAQPVFEQAFFTLYPNPTNGNFTIVQKGDRQYGNVKVEVYGMRGEKVLSSQMIGEQKHEFMTAALPAGLYFVKVVADDYAETIKLIKTQ